MCVHTSASYKAAPALTLAHRLRLACAGALPVRAAQTPAPDPTGPQRSWGGPAQPVVPAPDSSSPGAQERRPPACSWPGAPGRVRWVPSGPSATTQGPHTDGPLS